MASPCPIGPFPSEGRSSSCFTLKGVKCKLMHECYSLQGEASRTQCATQAKPSQFPCLEHRLKTPKTRAVTLLTCALLLALIDTARASFDAFKSQCILKWETLPPCKHSRRLVVFSYNFSDAKSVARHKATKTAAKKLAGYFVKPGTTATASITRRNTVSYSAGYHGGDCMDPKSYTICFLPGKNGVEVPVLQATDNQCRDWYVLPVLKNNKPVLAFVKVDFKTVEEDVHFYEWKSDLNPNTQRRVIRRITHGNDVATVPSDLSSNGSDNSNSGKSGWTNSNNSAHRGTYPIEQEAQESPEWDFEVRIGEPIRQKMENDKYLPSDLSELDYIIPAVEPVPAAEPIPAAE